MYDNAKCEAMAVELTDRITTYDQIRRNFDDRTQRRFIRRRSAIRKKLQMVLVVQLLQQYNQFFEQ